MKYMRSVFCVFFFLSSLFCLAAEAREGRTRQAVFAQPLIEEGKRLINENNHVAASHALAKALMIDPSNAEAKELLRFLHHGSYDSQNTDPLQRSRITETHTDRIARLEHEISSLQEKSAHRQKSYQKKVANLTSQIAELSRSLSDKEDLLKKRDLELAGLDKKFIDLETRFETARQEWENEKRVFARETADLESALAALRLHQDALNIQIASLETENNSLRDEILTAQRDSRVASGLEKALLENMKKVVLQKDFEIQRLKTDMASLNQNSDAIITMLSHKNHDIAILDTGIRQLQTRFSQEKAVWSHDRNTYEQNLAELRGTLESSQKVIATVHQNRQRHIDRLEADFVKSQAHMAQAGNALSLTAAELADSQKEIQAKNQIIRSLQNNLTALESELAQFQKSKNLPENTDLAGLTQSWQQTIKDIKTKDTLIAELKQDLADAKESLSALEHNAGQNQNKEFLALREHLTEIQKKLEHQIPPFNLN